MPKIECWECKHSFYSDCYLECGKGYKGIVNYNETCEHAEPKQAVTKEVTALKTDVIVMLKGSLALINRQKAEIERLKEERDMAVKDIYCSTKCFICKNMPSDGNMTHCPNYSSCGLAYIYFKWRGENNGKA